MDKLSKQDIQLFSKHAALNTNSIEKALQEQVYPDQGRWQFLLKLLTLALGAAFVGAGLLFFFAYNWQALHKFAKIGLIEVLLLGAVGMGLYPKFSANVQNTALSLACVMVGLLFAVFGQVYQTGANAYDFFLGWTMAVALWVLVTNFSPLWLFFVLLCNLTYWLYQAQTSYNFGSTVPYVGLLLLNSLFFIGFALFNFLQKTTRYPAWLLQCLGFLIIAIGSVGAIVQLFGGSDTYPYTSILVALVFLGITAYALYVRHLFYLALIGISVIVYGVLVVFKDSDFDTGVFFMSSIVVLLSFTGLSLGLRNLQRRWNHGH